SRSGRCLALWGCIATSPEAGGWRLEAGGWRLEAGGWRLDSGERFYRLLRFIGSIALPPLPPRLKPLPRKIDILQLQQLDLVLRLAGQQVGQLVGQRAASADCIVHSQRAHHGVLR